MGTRGPQPTPTQTLKMRGSWRAKLNSVEPQPAVCIPTMPDWLDERARAEWHYIAPKLEELGVLTEWDRNQLGLYCQTISDYHELAHTLATTPRNLMSIGSTEWNRLVAAKNQALVIAQRLAAEFGLSPATRTRIRSGDLGPAKADDKLRFFNSA